MFVNNTLEEKKFKKNRLNRTKYKKNDNHMKKTTSMNSVLIVENISVPFCKQRWHDAQRVNGIDSMDKGDSVTRKARGHSHKIIRRRIKRRSQQNDCICMSHVTTREFIVQNKDRKKATTIFWFVRSVTTEAMLFLLVLFFLLFNFFFFFFFNHSIYNYPFICDAWTIRHLNTIFRHNLQKHSDWHE